MTTRRNSQRAFGPALLVAACVGPLVGCPPECEDEPAGCALPVPCDELAFDCDSTASPYLQVLQEGDLAPQGRAALAAVDDIMLVNDQVAVVIDALHHANHLSESGGMVLDIATWPYGDDMLNHVWTGAGLLPDDVAVYTRLSTFERPGVAGVQVSGHLKGDARHLITTRYELHRCEPGLRVRSELSNEGDEDVVWALQDGYFWGEKSLLPFAPGPGYVHPSFGLGNINEVFRPADYIAGSGASDEEATVFAVGCNVDQVMGFHDDYVSAAGPERRIVTPGDGIVYERFIGAARGPGVGRANDIARTIRAQLHQDPTVMVSGRVVTPSLQPQGRQVRASILLRDAAEVFAEVVPDAEGNFSALVPRGRAVQAELFAFGRRQSLRTLPPVHTDAAFDTFFINDAAVLEINVTEGTGPSTATVFIQPQGDRTARETAAQYLGQGKVCAPMLGYPFGGSPACNRALVDRWSVLELPAGSYRIVASRGLTEQVLREDVDLNHGQTATVNFSFDPVDAFSPGQVAGGLVSADFHVHGSGSYDSSIPDRDRVLSLVASGIDVIAATDHDAISDYQTALNESVWGWRVHVLGGLEATPLVLHNLREDVTYPQVIGHWNFWPLSSRPDRPRRGAPGDEFAEPGELFDRIQRAGLGPEGIIQLNHPTSGATFGRANGWGGALSIRLDEPLPPIYDGTGPGLFLRTPPGATFSNADFHTVEVLNGTSGHGNFAHRAFWFYLLNQGILRAATAASDSHALSDSVLGTPRTLVDTATQVPGLNVVQFQDAVRRGHTIGTNGPVPLARIELAGGGQIGPDIARLHHPQPGDQLVIEVVGAPWVPIEQVRVIINGKFIHEEPIMPSAPNDVYGTTGAHRTTLRFPLDGFLPTLDTDAWMIVEAGAPLPLLRDLNCDTYPDTTDNNRDGLVDWMDVDRNGDKVFDDADLDRNGDGSVGDDDVPDLCTGGTGPIDFAPLTERDVYRAFRDVVPDGMPFGMTNPFLLDLDDDGRFDPPGVPP